MILTRLFPEVENFNISIGRFLPDFETQESDVLMEPIVLFQVI